MSPARQHRERALAAQAAHQARPGVAGPAPTSGPAATAYEQMLLKLHEDRTRLSAIQSVEAKIALKRELVPDYYPWIDGALREARDSGRAVQDEVIVNVLPWAIDIGDFPAAIAIAEHVLHFRLVLPERFNRTPACLVCEEIAEAAIARLAAGEGFDVRILLKVEELTAPPQDMPDQVRAKLNKAIGLELARRADAATPDDATLIAGYVPATRTEALTRLRRALQLNANVGVKKQIERLESALKRDPAPTDQNSTGPASTEDAGNADSGDAGNANSGDAG